MYLGGDHGDSPNSRGVQSCRAVIIKSIWVGVVDFAFGWHAQNIAIDPLCLRRDAALQGNARSPELMFFHGSIKKIVGKTAHCHPLFFAVYPHETSCICTIGVSDSLLIYEHFIHNMIHTPTVTNTAYNTV